MVGTHVQIFQDDTVIESFKLKEAASFELTDAEIVELKEAGSYQLVEGQTGDKRMHEWSLNDEAGEHRLRIDIWRFVACKSSTEACELSTMALFHVDNTRFSKLPSLCESCNKPIPAERQFCRLLRYALVYRRRSSTVGGPSTVVEHHHHDYLPDSQNGENQICWEPCRNVDPPLVSLMEFTTVCDLQELPSQAVRFCFFSYYGLLFAADNIFIGQQLLYTI